MKSKRLTEKVELGTAQIRKVQTDLSSKSNLKLLNELEEKMSGMTEDNFDFELVEQHLKLLQDRAPVMTDYDSSAEFDCLQNEHSILLNEDNNSGTTNSNAKHRKKAVRFLRITEVAVAAVLCLTVSANAFSFNPIEMFLNWAEEILQIQSGTSGIMELPEGSGSKYKSLEEALAKNGTDARNLPSWVPEDYNLVNVSAKISESTDKYIAYYAADRGDMIIKVEQSKTNWTETSEKNPGGHVYETSGFEYYIVSNVDDSKAGWTNGSYSYLIDGAITEAEVKKMIKSIQREH